MTNKNRNVLCLFSSAGIGELGIKALDWNILVNNEIVKNRCEIYKENYPEVKTICGDIWEKQHEIIATWNMCTKENPFLIYATPPCQGMSSNGAGKLLNLVRKGKRPKEDPRNRLIIPTMNIIKTLKPKWILFENVSNMKDTVIRDENDCYTNIIDYIKRELGTDYVGKCEIVNSADYGIPQTRRRLITIFTNSKNGKNYYKLHNSFLPETTHSEVPVENKKPWITLKEAIGNLPPLDAVKGKNECLSFHPWHFVPIMNSEKYWWMENTKEGETAYNNQCINPKCMYKHNPTHGSKMIDGIHSSNENTPIYCQKCGELLPRPSLIDKISGERRLLKGYDTAYKRMEWDKPAATLTQNFIYEASDKKVHPRQTMVLSFFEAMILQSISDYTLSLTINGKKISKNLCAEIIGESVPPKLIEMICNNIEQIEKSN